MKSYLLLLCVAISFTSHAQVRPDHIVIVILENKPDTKIEGNADAPYINSLIRDEHTAMMLNSFGLTHPSQPNYIMMFSGSNQGVTTNNLPDNLPFTTLNLGSSLLQHDYTFAGYSESMPSVGYQGETYGDYKRKHNPWANWQDAETNGIPASCNRPFTDFPGIYDSLPTLSYVVPNQQNDMHNGTIQEGDDWIKQNLGGYVEWCKTHNSLFILTFDEDDGSNDNGILTLFIGQHIRPGKYTQRITHYNLLRTVEELYGLPYAGASKDSASIRDIWDETSICSGSDFSLGAASSGISYQWQLNNGDGFVDISDAVNFSGTQTDHLSLKNIPTSWYGYKLRCIVAGKPGPDVTLRFASHFTGANDDKWENELNWSCGLPDINMDAYIDKGKAILHSNQSVRNLRLRAGTSLDIMPDASLNLNK